MEEKIIYKPLTADEIIDLLREGKDAARRGDTQLCVQCRIRLENGIPGMTDPRPLEGPVAEKQDEMDKLYEEWVQSDASIFGPELTAMANKMIWLLNT